MNTFFLKTPLLALTLCWGFCNSSFAANEIDSSGLCNDLASFSCAPGSYDDGTGRVKSVSELQDAVTSMTSSLRKSIRLQTDHLIADPKNAEFKKIALNALGLQNAPNCQSSDTKELAECDNNISEGLSTIAQKMTLGALNPSLKFTQRGNFKDLKDILKNEIFSGFINKINNEVEAMINKSNFSKKISGEIFSDVKSTLLERVSRMSIQADLKQKMLDKIKSVPFAGFQCSKPESSDHAVSALLTPNAFYSAKTNSIKFCAGLLLEENSEFPIIQTIAHELGHSIDPCNIEKSTDTLSPIYQYQNLSSAESMQAEFPIKNVLQCLRRPTSVEAKKVPPPVATNKSATPTSPSPANETPSFCNNDQITESFADWIAAEVTPMYMAKKHKLTQKQYLLGYSNYFREFCSMGDPAQDLKQSLDVHPSSEKRINNILLVNPQVRAQMGCKDPHVHNEYCATVDEEQKNSSSPQTTQSQSGQK